MLLLFVVVAAAVITCESRPCDAALAHFCRNHHNYQRVETYRNNIVNNDNNNNIVINSSSHSSGSNTNSGGNGDSSSSSRNSHNNNNAGLPRVETRTFAEIIIIIIIKMK